MASTYSTNLAIELIGTGDQAGSWGNTTNTNLGTLIEQAISGYVTQAVSTGTDTTITIPNGATGVARNMYIELTGTGGASTNLIVPANKKLYFIYNNTTGAVTVKVSGQTGVSVPQGKKMVLASNGTDIVAGENYIADFGSNSATITTLTATSATITNLTLTSLVISNLSIASANVTTLTSASATITNLINTSASITTITNSPTFSAGTANGVLYLNASKVATSGSALTFDGTNFSSTGTATVNSGNSSSVGLVVKGETGNGIRQRFIGQAASGQYNWQIGASITAAGEFSFMPSTAADGTTFTSSVYNITPTGVSYWSVGGSEAMRLTSTGLGIGTSSPATGAGSTKSVEASGPLLTGGAINAHQTSKGVFQFSGNETTIRSYGATAGTGQIVFNIGGGGGSADSEGMRLNASGNLGIGTSSPGQRLAVRSADNTGTTIVGRFESNNGNQAVGIRYNGVLGLSGGLILGTDGANAITFEPNSTERMRLDSSGNLGLGVTPSAWADSRAFQICNSSASPIIGGMYALENNGQGLVSNAYYDGTNWKFIYAASFEAARYELNSGKHVWYNSAAGTSGNTISFTQAMTLDASGNLGVGSTTPSSTGLDTGVTRLFAVAPNSDFGAAATFVSDSLGRGVLVTNQAKDTTATIAIGSSLVQFGSQSNTACAFLTNNTERARITATGEFLVGLTSGAKFSVSYGGNDTHFGLGANYDNYITAGSSGVTIFRNTSTERARIDSSGNLLVGKTTTSGTSGVGLAIAYDSASPTYSVVGSTSSAAGNCFQAYSTGAGAYRFYVDYAGTIFATNTTISAISDQRFKENISDLDVGLDAVMSLKPRKFDWKEGKGKDIKGDRGFIAQEFEQVFPDLVDEWRDPAPEGEEPYKSVRQDLIPVLVKAIQEQQAMINELKAEVAALKGV